MLRSINTARGSGSIKADFRFLYLVGRHAEPDLLFSRTCHYLKFIDLRYQLAQAEYMAENESLSRFERVAAELRKLGIRIRSLPGEYYVNYRHGGDASARFAEDLDEALELGRAMAAEKAAEQPATNKPPRRRWRRKRMTPKARRRRFILGHNRRLRARAMRKPRGKR